MKIFRSFALLAIAVLVGGCGVVKIPGYTDLSDEEARRRLYKAETFIELGAYSKAESELAAFPKNSRHRNKVEDLLDNLNSYRADPVDEGDPY